MPSVFPPGTGSRSWRSFPRARRRRHAGGSRRRPHARTQAGRCSARSMPLSRGWRPASTTRTGAGTTSCTRSAPGATSPGLTRWTTCSTRRRTHSSRVTWSWLARRTGGCCAPSCWTEGVSGRSAARSRRRTWSPPMWTRPRLATCGRCTSETTPAEERAEALAEEMEELAWVGGRVGLRQLADARREGLPDLDAFLPRWTEQLGFAAEHPDDAEARALLAEATLLGRGVDGLGDLARERGPAHPELFLDWIGALTREDRVADATAACHEALAALGEHGEVRAK